VAGKDPFEHVILTDAKHRGELHRGDQPLDEVEVVPSVRKFSAVTPLHQTVR